MIIPPYISPFQINQIITINSEVFACAIKAWERAVEEWKRANPNTTKHLDETRKSNFIFGHAAQFAHNDAFIDCGVEIDVPDNPYAPFDRKVAGVCQDDKLANPGKLDELSKYHYASLEEIAFWNSEVKAGRDVYLQSFEVLSPFECRYRGPISYRLSQAEWRPAGDDKMSLMREPAYKHNIPRFK